MQNAPTPGEIAYLLKLSGQVAQISNTVFSPKAYPTKVGELEWLVRTPPCTVAIISSQ